MSKYINNYTVMGYIFFPKESTEKEWLRQSEWVRKRFLEELISTEL